MMRTGLVLVPLAGCIYEIEAPQIMRVIGTLPVEAETTLDLYTEEGDLEIIGEADRTTVELEVRVLRTGLTPWSLLRTDDDLRALVAELTTDGSTIRVESYIDLSSHPFSSELLLRVPADLALIVDDGSGDIEINNVAALDLRNKSGDVRLSTVPGPLSIDDEFGDLWLESVGPLHVAHGRGDIEALNVNGDVVLHDQLGDIHLEAVNGRIDIQDLFGHISVLRAGSTAIQDESGDIVVEDIDGDVDINDESGEINVRRVSGTVTIVDGSGDITAEDVGELDVLFDTSGAVSRR